MNIHTENGYSEIFKSIDRGMSYEDASRKTHVSEKILRLEHIEFAKRQLDYDKQIQKFTIKLIQDVGIHFIKALRRQGIDEISMPKSYEFETISEFFEARANDIVPFKYRATCKALALRYVEQLD